MILESFKTTFKKGNKMTGLVTILVSLIMLFSMIAFTWKANPFYLVQAYTIIPFLGNSITLLIWIALIWFSLSHFYNLDLTIISGKRKYLLIILTYLIMSLISIIIIEVDILETLDSGYISLEEYYDWTFVDRFTQFNSSWTNLNSQYWFVYLGAIQPLVFWLIGGWGYGILSGILIIILVSYVIYVLVMNDFNFLFVKLAFWKKDEANIQIEKHNEDIDLNLETKEFKVSLKNKKKLISKDKNKERDEEEMKNQDYQELSKKISDEKQKLVNLREQVINKVRQSNEDTRSTSKITDEQREEIISNLGYTSYSQIKRESERRSESPIESKVEGPYRFTKEDESSVGETENNSIDTVDNEINDQLIEDGYKTTEQAYGNNENVKSLSDDFIYDVADEIAIHGENTNELPLIENYYNELFTNEDNLIEEINKTLETKLDISNDNTFKSEVIIEDIKEEVTVEEYISMSNNNFDNSYSQASNGQEIELIEKEEPEVKNNEFDYTEFNQDELKELGNIPLNEVEKTVESILEYENNPEELSTQNDETIKNVDEENSNSNVDNDINKNDDADLNISNSQNVELELNDNSQEESFEQIEEENNNTNNLEVEIQNKTYDDFEWEEETEEVEIKKERSPDWCEPYVLPSTSILTTIPSSFNKQQLVDEASDKASKLNEVFSAFNVKATVNSFEIGPTITVFKISIEPGIKTTKVTNLEDNLKLTLGAQYIRIIAPIPGTSFIGIEVPNSVKAPVPFKTVYDETSDSNEGIIISIGQDVSGKSMSFDLTKAPHLLVAGSTGSGKSVAINTILASILLRYKPTDVQLVLVDPKMVEFTPFHDVPHLLSEVITDATNANNALKAMVEEMENRYKLMAEEGVKKLEELNNKYSNEGKNKLPYVVIIIDELADLMMVSAKEVEDSIMRITQKARAAGIHMILATQRPSTEIITGTIKSNIPSRMAFTVASSIDSRTILGQVGAEKLIGMGDMLVSLYGQLPVRGQGAYISNEEVEDITAFTKSQCDAEYMIDIEKFGASLTATNGNLIATNDPMYIAAKDTVLHHQKASTSMLQRHLNIGYNKAANIIETLEAEGIVGPSKGSKPREILKGL